MNVGTFADAMKAYYSREDVLLSFDMYHPTRIDMEPELDWSSMENYYRSLAEQNEFHLHRYQQEYGYK